MEGKLLLVGVLALLASTYFVSIKDNVDEVSLDDEIAT